MRIGLNALFLIPGRVGGSETYLRGLVHGLNEVDTRNDYILFVGPEAAASFRHLPSRWRLVVSPAPSAKRAARLTLEQTWLPLAAKRLGAELFHSAGYTAPLVCPMPSVVSILDMNYRRHPEDLSLAERLVYAGLIPRVARRSRQVITLSEAARSDILRWTGAAPDRVTAVHLAPRSVWPGDPATDAARLAEAGATGPYVLSVAASYPHKNLRRVVEAFPLDEAEAGRVKLVLVGLKGRTQQELTLIALGRSDLVVMLGWIDDALLATLYRNAMALAFPSLYEGFGLPILEAMALGAPVLTSNYGAMAEVAGDAAELVDPTSVDEIRRGLRRLALDTHRRGELRERGLRHAARFSWEQTARLTLQVYQRALEAP